MPDDEPRPVLRVFLSSTSEDLGEHRDAVTDAILRVGDLPVTIDEITALSSCQDSIFKIGELGRL